MTRLHSKTFEIINRPEEFINIYKFQLELDDEMKYKKEIFVDSSDFVHMILGINNYYKILDEFQTDLFHKKMTMLHSLIYKEYLGSVKLLNPHMFEFLDLNISTDANISKLIKIISREDLAYVLKLNLLEQTEVFNKMLADVMSYSDIQEMAETIFKLTYLINKDLPKQRFMHLIERKIFSFDTDSDFDVPKLTNSLLFKKLYAGLNKLRDNKSINNFRDALALCQLQEKLTHVNNLDGSCIKTIPLFYARPQILLLVKDISEDVELLIDGKKPFIFKGDESGEQLIVQGEDFFILDALYNFRKGQEKGNMRFADFFTEIDNVLNTINAGKESFGKVYSPKVR
jgi:hypothetical protein